MITIGLRENIQKARSDFNSGNITSIHQLTAIVTEGMAEIAGVGVRAVILNKYNDIVAENPNISEHNAIAEVLYLLEAGLLDEDDKKESLWDRFFAWIRNNWFIAIIIIAIIILLIIVLLHYFVIQPRREMIMNIIGGVS